MIRWQRLDVCFSDIHLILMMIFCHLQSHVLKIVYEKGSKLTSVTTD